MRNKERNECWFDAKEDFTGTDLSGESEEVGKCQEKQDTVGLRGEVPCFKVMYLIMALLLCALCPFLHPSL